MTIVAGVVLQLPAPARGWHARLAAALAEMGVGVALRRGRAARLSPGVAAVLRCEALLGRVPSSMAATPDPPSPSPPRADWPVLVLDGAGGNTGSLQPLFDGAPGEHSLFASLLGGRAPVVTVAEATPAGLFAVAAALPALSEPLSLARSVDEVHDRLVVLLVAALTLPRVPVPEMVPLPSIPRALATPAGFVARKAAAKVARRVLRRKEHWRIVVRRRGALRTLADDGRRYYADPFPFAEGGRTHVFFEDFPDATGKGVISAAALEADGFGPPAVALERPYHLSYPLVLAEDGTIYMIPESCAARRVELYRADPYPLRWTLDAVLLDGVALADATVVRHAGRHWMFAASAEPPGSSWDRLMIFHAPALRGPWTAHARNPVLIDAGGARPAGRMWHENGMLLRVAQDCRRGYGDGVVTLRVDRLTPDDYRQTRVADAALPPGLGADGLHTLNRQCEDEFIDLRYTRRRGPA